MKTSEVPWVALEAGDLGLQILQRVGIQGFRVLGLGIGSCLGFRYRVWVSVKCLGF